MGGSFVKQFFANILEEELPMKWRYGMMDAARCTSGVAGPSLRKIMTSTKGFFMIFDYHCGTSKFDVKIYDGTQCQKTEVHFQ
jgi:hypothetical protein